MVGRYIIVAIVAIVVAGGFFGVTQFAPSLLIFTGIEFPRLFTDIPQFIEESDGQEANVITCQHDEILNEDIGKCQPIIEPPSNFEPTTDDLLKQFIESLGIKITETFGVKTETTLIDANAESEVKQSFLTVQPIDPTEVIIIPEEGIDIKRFFINTDFASQLADDGVRSHPFSGWDLVIDPSKCTTFTDASGDKVTTGCPVSNLAVTISSCASIEGTKCVMVGGRYRNSEDTTPNKSNFAGVHKDISIRDWTREGELILSFDYSCGIQSGANTFAIINGKKVTLSCVSKGRYQEDVSGLITDPNQNILAVSLGGNVLNVDNYNWDVRYNNVQLLGNSVILRQSAETIEGLGLTILKTATGVPLNLGFIETRLVGESLFDGEEVLLDGVLEIRLDDKTVSTHAVTANGITINKQIPLRIDGRDSIVFSLNPEDFVEGFHVLKFLLNDFVVNLGSGSESRTFEYHVPFVLYSLEFESKPNEILGFNEQDRAISFPKSDSTLAVCGLSAGEPSEAEVLPPSVEVISGGFVIAKTNPTAGKNAITNLQTGEVEKNAEFCSIVPNLPRETQITYKVEDSFYTVNSPSGQKNWYLKCTRDGCGSNFGYSK